MIFAAAVYSQESTFEKTTLSTNGNEEEDRERNEIESANVLKSSFQIVRPYYDNSRKERVLRINTAAMKALENYFTENNDDSK